MRRLLYCIVIFIISFSCAREEDISIKTAERSKLVVFSAITPGDSLHVYIERTTPLNTWVNQADLLVLDATVMLHDANGDSISLKLLSEDRPLYGVSQATFKITAGETYYLTVKTIKGEEVNAQCTVPVQYAHWQTLENKGVVGNNGINNYNLIEGAWQGLEQNLYNYAVSISYYSSALTKSFNQNANIQTITQFDNLYIFSDSFLSDYYDSLNFVLSTTDKNLGSFNQMQFPYLLQRDVKKGNLVNSFKGVYPEFTNINGGYGVFGAYIADQKSIEF